MDWISWAITGAAMLHIVEEHFYPGGFLEALQQVNPRLGPSATPRFAQLMNSLFLLLCIVCALVGSNWLGLTLSVASLLFWNALLHVGATMKLRRYMPGTVTAILLYVPLSILAYFTAVTSELLTTTEFVVSLILGLAWNLVPIGSLAVWRLTHVTGV